MNVLDPELWASFVALAVAVAAGVGVLAVWNSTRPRRVPPGPATMDLREETPAIVDLLTGGFEVEDDAVPATAVDLARRRFFDIEQHGDAVVMRLRTGGDESALTAYERRVLRQIQGHAQHGTVPAAALTIGPDGVSERWYRGFVREVTKHARSLGLCRRRFGVRQLGLAWLLVAVANASAWIVIATAPRADDPVAWGSVANILLLLAVLAGIGVFVLAGRMTRTDTQADTADGRTAAAHWLGVREFYRDAGNFEDKPAASVEVWERHLAYATAMGLAPEVQRQLPFETEHDRHAWSRATGQWRRVKVRYQSARPGWGDHPGRVAFEGLVRAAIFGAISWFALSVARADDDLASLEPDQRRWVGLAALVVAVGAAVLAAYGLVRLIVGIADLVPRTTIEGEVIRRRRFREGHRLPKVLQWMIWSGRDEHGLERSRNRTTKYHLAVDDGSDDRVLAYTVRSEIHAAAPQGARVRIKVSPLLGYVSDLQLLSAPPASAATAPDVLHPLIEHGIATAGTSAAAKLDELSATAGDVTDDDGVTLDEHVADARRRVDDMIADPRIANSPVGGLLAAFGSSTQQKRSGNGAPDESAPGDAATD